MEILLVRHAIAEDRDIEKWPDDRGRPLTREGARKFRSVARVLGRVSGMPDCVLSSPLARAWQTAQILEESCRWPDPEEFPPLEPDRRPASVLVALRKRPEGGRIVLVGHEPLMHELLSHLVGGPAANLSVEMKKGGAALVRCAGGLRAGSGVLAWLLPPRAALASADE